MFVIIWEYKIKPEYRQTFLNYYKSDGEWVRFFRQDENYLSKLLVLSADEEVYLTIDRWRTEAAYQAFQQQQQSRYKELDEYCEQLTVEEKLIGKYFVIGE
jgi:heme-degrading monooxygenase HmoA